MKNRYWSSIAAGVLLPAVAMASSYAPVADFSHVGTNPQCRLTTMQESFLKNWTPPAQYFLVPAYPNAKLTSAMPRGTAQFHGRTYQTFPSAVLLSSDPVGNIVDYYRERLGPGWHRAEDLGLVYLYQTPKPLPSGGALTQLLMSQPGSIPHIAIDSQITPCDQLLVPGAQTRITIVAQPR